VKPGDAHIGSEDVATGHRWRTHVEEEITKSRSKVKLSPGLEEGDDASQERG